ncbi:MAG: 4-alpha-glucanotransferase [Propionibacteriaceae bacterium]|nr:4-alpha-glucanotransferase [Propionibacteriaceae bacterium]
MPTSDRRIARLAHSYGIATEFWDWKGHFREPSEETLIACLKALGVDVSTEGWVDNAFVEADERIWKQQLPDCVVVEENHVGTVHVHVRAGRPAHVWVRMEDGATLSLDQIDNQEPDRLIGDHWVGRATFQLPVWAKPGYHQLFLESDDQSCQTSFIVTPSHVDIPGTGAGSVWGLMAQLYSVYGENSWGLGDFSDLADLAVWAKTGHGADFVLINPTHASQVIAPMEPSPYFPATRRFTNPIYIRPEVIEEYAAASDEVRSRVEQSRHQAYTMAQASTDIPRDAVWRAKKDCLNAIFQVGLRPSRQMEFQAFIDRQGVSLSRYAVWCALTETYGQRWRDWPKPYQTPDSPAVEEFATRHSTAITFYMWLQWIASLQARQAQATATNVGMSIGVMSDLAVGVDPDGEETWAMPGLFASGVCVGAPPDEYNQAGQDWRQPPWRPDRLRQSGYAPLRAMFSSMLSNSGALRIDHILGLFRVWWIPDGMTPDQGAYVRYDHEATVGILALEAYRARKPVIGEDLGTAEPWARDYLARRGIAGTSVVWFENDEDGHPLEPRQWRQLCLASVTTHDLPPTLGYLAHDHVSLRYRLGLLTEPLEDEVARDASEQEAMLDTLSRLSLMPPGETDHHQILLALYRFLQRTPAKLKGVALTDVVGDRRIQNQPGTVDEYPNWRVPLRDETGRKLTLEQIYALTSVADVTQIMNGRLERM